MANGLIGIEIIDYNIASGDGRISELSMEGYFVDKIKSDVQIESLGDQSYRQYIIESQSSGFQGYGSSGTFIDPILKIAEKTGNNTGISRTFYNDNWIDSNISGNLNSTKYQPLLTKDAAVLVPYERITSKSNLSISIEENSNVSHNFYTGYGALKIYDYRGDVLDSTSLVTADSAWASYNVQSGVQYKRITSWAVEIYNDLVLSGAYILDTGVITGRLPTLFSSGYSIQDTYLGYCIATHDEDCDTKPLEDKIICYSGVPSGQALDLFLSGVRKQFESSYVTPYDAAGKESIDENEIISYFSFWSGRLDYNSWKSGDRICFDLYPYNYEDLYYKHFKTTPLHPSTGFCLVYPDDFTDIYTLKSSFDARLGSGTSINIWYPYDCVSGEGRTGIYVDGASLYTEILSESGVDNILSFYSLRNLPSGFDISIKIQERTPEGYKKNDTLKYYLPSDIRLQGSNDNSTWTTIQTQSGIDWLSIEPVEKTITGRVYDTGIIFVEDDKDKDDEDDPTLPSITGTGQIITLDEFYQSGNKFISKYCPPEEIFRKIQVVYPSGVSCKDDDEDNNGDGQESGDSDGSGQSPPISTLRFLRTGWNLPSYSTYDYYRVQISGLNTNNHDHSYNSNQFYLKNINLWGSTENIMFGHTGKPECLIGSDYTLDIEGVVPVTLTGELSRTITKDHSGVYCFENQKVAADISGLHSGDLVTFNKKQGRLVVESGTGYISDCITGSDCYKVSIPGFFYNPITQELTFEQEFSGCYSGSGQISGDYVALKQTTVNRETMLGGLLGSPVYVTIHTGALFTGNIDYSYSGENLSGEQTITGQITGQAVSGKFAYSDVIYVNLSGANVNYGSTTGYINSQGIIEYNSPQNNDYVVINGKSVIYNSDTINFNAPDYYSSISSLVDIINNNDLLFNVSAQQSGNKVLLKSLVSGNLGNSISLEAGGGTGTGTPFVYSPTLTGGQDLYRQIKATGVYSGKINVNILQTGFYSYPNGTGTIQGYVPTYMGSRDFTGVWNITTGDFITGYTNFLENNLMNSLTEYYSAISGSGFGFSPTQMEVVVNFDNLFGYTGIDSAILTVSGLGTNSGITYHLIGG